MDIKLPFDFAENSRNFLRRSGYAEINDYNSGKTSYVKRLSQQHYPRFHVYINEKDGLDVISLHLDQKKPSYAGSHAHSGEYDGQVVTQEGGRIKGLIKNQMDNQSQQKEPEEKKGFFAQLFK